MNEELKVIIKAEIGEFKKNVDNAKKSIKDFIKEGTSDFGKFNEAFQKVGDAAKTGLKVAAGAIAGATTALLGMAAATEEYRTAQAKLTTAFETAGSTTEQAKQTYNDLYRVLGDGDVAVEAANHLAQLTTSEQALSEWTTICQGVYATFGDSLPIEGLTEAANETAKVGQLTGSLADALNWAGVNEEEFQAKLDACNTEAEREALIRETLTGIYNEAAAGYEKNAAGLLAQNEANAKMTESMSKLGEAVAPVNTMLTELGAEILADLAPYVQDFASKYMPKIKDALKDVGEKIGVVINWIADNWNIISTIGAIILAIATALSVVSTALSVYNTVMAITSVVSAPVIGIVAAIVAGIAALIAIIVLCVKHWDDICAAVTKFATTVGEWLSNLWDSITQWFSDMIAGFQEWWANLTQGFTDWWNGITTGITEWWNNLKQGWSDFWTGVGEKVSEGITKVKDGFNDMKDKVSETVGNLKEDATQKFEDIKTNVTTKVTDTVQNVKDKYQEMKQNVSDKVAEIKQNVSDKYNEIKENMTNAMETAKNNVKQKLDNIKQAYNENGGGIKGIVAGAMQAVKDTFNSVLNSIDKLTGGKFSNILSTIKTKMNSAFDAIGSVLGKIADKFQAVFDKAKTIVSSAIEKIKGFFKFDWSLPKIKLPHFSISGKFSLDPPSIPHFSVSWYEHGGVFDSPSLFPWAGGIGGLGENGAEAIVPLEKNTQWLDKIADRLNRNSGRPIYMVVDGKVFAQVAVDSINDLTTQTGSLPLKFA